MMIGILEKFWIVWYIDSLFSLGNIRLSMISFGGVMCICVSVLVLLVKYCGWWLVVRR